MHNGLKTSKYLFILVFQGCYNEALQTGRLNQQELIVLQFCGWKSDKGHQQGCNPSGGSRGESLSLSFPIPRGCLHPLAQGPFLHLQSRQYWCLSDSSLSSPISDHSWGKFSAFKRNLHTVFHSGGLIYIPTNSAQGFQLLHIFSNICSLLSFW